MKLRIINDAADTLLQKPYDYEMKPSALQQNGAHAFIKSHQWDEIEIDLTEDIPKDSLHYIHMCTNRIKVNLPDIVTSHIMLLLCEIYPELTGKIRKTFLIKGDMNEVLREVR